MFILVFNPGGNSLKAQIVECDPGQRHAFEASERVSLGIEGIGKEPNLLRYEGKSVVAREPVDARDYVAAADSILNWLTHRSESGLPILKEIGRVAIRVVHGGPKLTAPAELTDEIVAEVEAFEKLAPLHNKPSLDVLTAVRKRFTAIPVIGVFDSAFHHTIPEEAALYAIPTELSKRRQIRRYGFHGISHRYLLERYANLQGKRPEECTLITMHLESGCSLTAIKHGRSIDNTMGLTPLEGLMMGTRSGDVDPSLIPFLVREEGLGLDEVMEVLNKRSGLLGISEESLDTRELIKKYDTNSKVKLAIDMFCYRIAKAVGAYLTILGGADAIVFGGGIGENGVFLRRYIGEKLRWCGLELDAAANERLIDIEGKFSTSLSKLQAWVIVTREGLEIAHECCRCPTRT
jgi:acetate kinase